MCNCQSNDVERTMLGKTVLHLILMKSILVCRVVLGSACKMLKPTDKTNPLRRPPEKLDGRQYDSVMGESRKWDPNASVEFREFIIYDRQISHSIT